MNGARIIASDLKYESDVLEVANSSYKRVMRLRIKKLERADIGLYECFAKNMQGETRGRIRVQESSRQTGSRLQASGMSRPGQSRQQSVLQTAAANRKWQPTSCHEGSSQLLLCQRIKATQHALIPSLSIISSAPFLHVTGAVNKGAKSAGQKSPSSTFQGREEQREEQRQEDKSTSTSLHSTDAAPAPRYQQPSVLIFLLFASSWYKHRCLL